MDKKRICFYIPESGYVPEQGWRVSIVTEGEPGHAPTGTWPYRGRVGETMPWFWGHDYAKACKLAKVKNLELGLNELDVDKIIASSIAVQLGGKKLEKVI